MLLPAYAPAIPSAYAHLVLFVACRKDYIERQAARYVYELELVLRNAFIPASGLALYVQWTPSHHMSDLDPVS